MKRIVMAITGASGAVYARRLVQSLVAADVETHIVISPMGRRLLHDELGLKRVVLADLAGSASPRARLYDYRDLGAALSSGSFLTDGMVICPCSSNTLGAVAAGLGDNLIARAAAVTLKEARRLVLVTREMPLSQMDIANMLRLSQAGAVICPATPGFYLHPQSVADLVDFVVGKVLDLLGLRHELNTRWDADNAAHTASAAGRETAE